MGKVRRVRSWYLFCFLIMFQILLISSITVKAESTVNLEVEQIVTKMPHLKVYLTGNDASKLEQDQITAYRENSRLSFRKLQRFQESGEGVHYYLLLDVSQSIREDDFSALKEAVWNFADGLQEKDTMTLLTFGDEVISAWSESEKLQALEEKLSVLVNDNMNTQLYEALGQAANLCMQKRDTMRKVAIVLTDGVDDIKGKATKNEATQKLEEAGLPVYGIAIGDGENSGVERFGELVRSSHGTLTLAQEGDAVNKMADLQKWLQGAYILYLSGSSNVVSNGIQTVKLEFAQWNLVKNVETGFYNYASDTTIPEMKTAEQAGENQILLSFSERIRGIDNPANYELMNQDGKSIVPQGAVSSNKKEVTLTFTDSFYEGEYSLKCSNLTDVSMEKNKVANTLTVKLEGKKESKIQELLKSWGWAAAIAGILLAIVVLVIIYKKVKKNKGIVVVDNKLTLASKVEKEVRQVVGMTEKRGMHLMLYVSSGKSEETLLERDLYDSLIVGRSEICELCIKDDRMSKQHFALELENGIVFISDLESTNGTVVNGVKISHKQKLRMGDKVVAGNTTLRVEWT